MSRREVFYVSALLDWPHYNLFLSFNEHASYFLSGCFMWNDFLVYYNNLLENPIKFFVIDKNGHTHEVVVRFPNNLVRDTMLVYVFDSFVLFNQFYSGKNVPPYGYVCLDLSEPKEIDFVASAMEIDNKLWYHGIPLGYPNAGVRVSFPDIDLILIEARFPDGEEFQLKLSPEVLTHEENNNLLTSFSVYKSPFTPRYDVYRTSQKASCLSFNYHVPSRRFFTRPFVDNQMVKFFALDKEGLKLYTYPGYCVVRPIWDCLLFSPQMITHLDRVGVNWYERSFCWFGPEGFEVYDPAVVPGSYAEDFRFICLSNNYVEGIWYARYNPTVRVFRSQCQLRHIVFWDNPRFYRLLSSR